MVVGQVRMPGAMMLQSIRTASFSGFVNRLKSEADREQAVLLTEGLSQTRNRRCSRVVRHTRSACRSAPEPPHDPERPRPQAEETGPWRLQGPALRGDAHCAGGLLVSPVRPELPRHRRACRKLFSTDMRTARDRSTA